VLTTVAVWPVGSFLENVAVRADGSMLVTELNKKQLWFMPAPVPGALVQPVLVHTFDQPPFDIQEATRDVFYVDTATFLTTHESFLQRVDLRHWAPGMPVPVDQVLQFPAPASSVNGSCLLAPDVLLVADSAGLIWRVDLTDNGRTATAQVWLQDPSMNPGPPVIPPQPGINGIEYGKKAGFVYYTSTFQELFLRVPVDPETFNPAGAPELIATGSLWDDFDIDEKAGAAYITTHRQNTLQRVPLDPHGGQAIQTIAGQPFDPSSPAPRTSPGDRARTMSAPSPSSPPTAGSPHRPRTASSGPPNCCASTCPVLKDPARGRAVSPRLPWAWRWPQSASWSPGQGWPSPGRRGSWPRPGSAALWPG